MLFRSDGQHLVCKLLVKIMKRRKERMRVVRKRNNSQDEMRALYQMTM